MIKLIRKFLDSVKRKDRLARIERLRSAFSIQEKEGKLWIVYGNTGIFRVESFANTSEVVRILEDTKDFAVEYAFGEKKEREEVDARVIDNPFYVKPDIEEIPV